MTLNPIGIIHTPHRRAAGTPVQAALASGVRGTVEVFAQYTPALKDLEGFERIWLLYWFDRANSPQLLVRPYLDTAERGLFATRAPSRPNPIGLSPVGLLRVEDNILHIEDVDILDGTPLLDIKPYVPRFDVFEAKRIGWLAECLGKAPLADGRFELGEDQNVPRTL